MALNPNAIAIYWGGCPDEIASLCSSRIIFIENPRDLPKLIGSTNQPDPNTIDVQLCLSDIGEKILAKCISKAEDIIRLVS